LMKGAKYDTLISALVAARHLNEKCHRRLQLKP
jgi:hypothetical protein